jgi:uncharacterized protein YdeI (YjbR/CyaY-like superfamily)
VPDNQPPLYVASAADWDAWLAREHDHSGGVWLKLAKKGSGLPSIPYADLLEVALTWGWIDAQRKPLDRAFFLQRFTPRRPNSPWSKINTDKAEQLIAAGRMKPPGLRQVEAAKADGRWAAAYAGQRSAEVPGDLRQALDASPGAAELFGRLSSQNRYAILYRLQSAKRPETRTRRIRQFVAMLARGETIYPQSPRPPVTRRRPT